MERADPDAVHTGCDTDLALQTRRIILSAAAAILPHNTTERLNKMLCEIRKACYNRLYKKRGGFGGT